MTGQSGNTPLDDSWLSELAAFITDRIVSYFSEERVSVVNGFPSYLTGDSSSALPLRDFFQQRNLSSEAQVLVLIALALTSTLTFTTVQFREPCLAPAISHRLAALAVKVFADFFQPVKPLFSFSRVKTLQSELSCFISSVKIISLRRSISSGWKKCPRVSRV